MTGQVNIVDLGNYPEFPDGCFFHTQKLAVAGVITLTEGDATSVTKAYRRKETL